MVVVVGDSVVDVWGDSVVVVANFFVVVVVAIVVTVVGDSDVLGICVIVVVILKSFC